MKPSRDNYRVRSILPFLIKEMERLKIPYHRVRSADFVRVHPHGIFDSINICEMPALHRRDAYIVRCHVDPVWIKDMDRLAVYLSAWDRSYTAFVYTAHEFYEPRAPAFPNVLEALASWMAAEQVHLMLYKAPYSDAEFKRFALWEITKRLERRNTAGIYDVIRWGK